MKGKVKVLFRLKFSYRPYKYREAQTTKEKEVSVISFSVVEILRFLILFTSMGP